MDKIMWWGYLHSNKTIQVKRWFGDHKDYSRAPGGDCYDNDFVVEIVPPFEADSRDAAETIIANKLGFYE